MAFINAKRRYLLFAFVFFDSFLFTDLSHGSAYAAALRNPVII